MGLETLVTAGFVDGLTTAQIFAKYPHFGEKFLYKPFNSGLTKIRVKHNKERTSRGETSLLCLTRQLVKPELQGL
jgi:hypothetical protein